MHNCIGCEALGFERYRNGSIVPRCYAPWPPCYGNGRVIDNPSPEIIPKRILAPKWCRGKIENKEQGK